MNRIDDQLLEEFRGVTEQLHQEFGNLDSAVPVFVVPEKRPASRRPLVIRLAVAATIAGLIAIAPTLTNRDNHSIVGSAAWAAVPTKLTTEQVAEIRSLCISTMSAAGEYSAIVTDTRLKNGLMLLASDRGENFDSDRRYSTILCRYEETEKGFSVPEINMGETPSDSNISMWGGTSLGDLKIWQFAEAVNPRTTRVVIRTAEGYSFDASLDNGFALAWWPRVTDDNHNTAFADEYGSDGELIQTRSLITGLVTKP
jgi:hypothetical protein